MKIVLEIFFEIFFDKNDKLLPQTISEVFLAKFQLGPEYSAWFLIFLFAPFAVSISNQLIFEYYKTVLKKKFHVSFDIMNYLTNLKI